MKIPELFAILAEHFKEYAPLKGKGLVSKQIGDYTVKITADGKTKDENGWEIEPFMFHIFMNGWLVAIVSQKTLPRKPTVLTAGGIGYYKTFYILNPLLYLWLRMTEEVRTVVLNALPLTKAKEEKLNSLLERCIEGTEYLLAALSYMEIYGDKLTRYELQKKTYEYLKNEIVLPSQIIIDLTKDVFASSAFRFSKYSIPYNVPRSGRLSHTKSGNPVMSISIAQRQRMGIPIAQDGAWIRFNEILKDGYTWTAFRLKRTRKNWQILISLRRKVEPIGVESVIGIDIGSRCLATMTLISAKGIEKQLYFGRDIWERQRDISIRRSKLQRYSKKGVDKEKARKKLRAMRHKERNYVKTRCYEIAHEIVRIAKEKKSVIAIENLNGLKNAQGHRKSNRRTKRMPYRIFRVALESVSKREGIKVIAVSPRHTSKWCPKCGSLGKRKAKGSIFVCPKCGREVNADRNASLNIALRAAEVIRNHKLISSQSSEGGPAVNRVGWQDEGEGVKSWHGYLTPDCKPTFLRVGS